MKCDDDNNNPSTYITFWIFLTVKKFKWLNQKEIDKFDIKLISENSLDGYILEVDLEYPDELYEIHNDYPLVSGKPEINHDMLSRYWHNISNKYDFEIGGVNKLIQTLGQKSKYILHYKNLHLYLSLGMKLVGVPRILEFKQSD